MHLDPTDADLIAYAITDLGVHPCRLNDDRLWTELVGCTPAWLVSAWLDLQTEPLDAAEQLEADFIEAEEADTAEERFWMAA